MEVLRPDDFTSQNGATVALGPSLLPVEGDEHRRINGEVGFEIPLHLARTLKDRRGVDRGRQAPAREVPRDFGSNREGGPAAPIPPGGRSPAHIVPDASLAGLPEGAGRAEGVAKQAPANQPLKRGEL